MFGVFLHSLPYMLNQVTPVYIGATLGVIYSGDQINSPEKFFITLFMLLGYSLFVFIGFDYTSRINMDNLRRYEDYTNSDIRNVYQYYTKSKITIYLISFLLVFVSQHIIVRIL